MGLFGASDRNNDNRKKEIAAWKDYKKQYNINEEARKAEYGSAKQKYADDVQYNEDNLRFGEKERLNQFMKMKFDFDKFTEQDWYDYWIIAQHCDDFRQFQQQALSIIKRYLGPDYADSKGNNYYKSLIKRNGNEKIMKRKEKTAIPKYARN